MAETQSRPRFVRFGAFEADVQTGELRKDGVKLKFSGQPFQVLAILLERPGEVVTREELQKRLWPDTFVDVERNLNTAVNKIREVLGDSAETPLFIETLPRRGYRFIGQVEAPAAAAASVDSNGKVNSPQGLPESAAPPGQTDHGPDRDATDEGSKKGSRTRHRTWSLWGASALVAILASLLWYQHRPMPPPHISEYVQLTHDGKAKSLVGTDGNRIYFNEFSPRFICQVAISGGEIAHLTTSVPGQFALVAVSQDGSSFLIASTPKELKDDLPLWNVRILGGFVRRLGDAVDASFSPDGNFVAYSTAKGDIYVVRSDGTEAHKLASPGGAVGGFSWSPVGSTIRFVKDERIWEMSSNGSNPHPLLPGWHPSEGQVSGRWTADGRFFVFRTFPKSIYTPGSVSIWALDERPRLFRAPANAPVQLTPGPLAWGGPFPGKDGKKIFARGTTMRGELSRFDSQAKAFRPFLGGISAQFVTFSHDGEAVAYVSFPEGVLWKANRDGSNPVQLTDAKMNVLVPRWSPDGTEIAFFAFDERGVPEIYVVSSQADGSPRRLLPEDPGAELDFSWSPDGSKIVFDTRKQIGVADEGTVLRVLDLASHQVTTLPGSAGMYSPRWSPDGRSIAAKSYRFERGLQTFDVASQRWSVLPLKFLVDFPVWSRDSRFIYFVRQLGDNPGILRIRVKGGDPELVADLKGWDWVGLSWMELDPTDAPMMLHNAGSDDIYALTLEEK